MLKLTILGNSAAIPTLNRNTTAQILRHEQHAFLLDCGEGTQIQILKYKIRSNFEAIFISHLHGDHCFGLVPLLSSMSLNGRKTELFIIGPQDLQNYVQTQLNFTQAYLNFPLHYLVPQENNQVVYENANLEVRAFRLNHRIETYGYVFREKPKPPKFLVEKARALQVSPHLFKLLKKGIAVENIHGQTILPEQVLGQRKKNCSYAFCTDTAFYPEIVPYIEKVTLLYHEATFKHSEIQKAVETYHSTALQAATIAQLAQVQKLLIGHVSARYFNLEQEVVQEAQTIFPHTEYAQEGKTFLIE
ncbi:MAG: ribonuclease Z [Bacteroidia bacterium]|nr:ribonuclease Z [Bacteroidia bacterium]